jgi:hypothetical protein
MWDSGYGSIAPVTPARASRFLAGTWDVVSVQTTARTSPTYERFQWRFVTPDSAHARNACPPFGCRAARPVVAVVAAVDPKVPFDSALLVHGVEREDRGQVVYDQTANHLSLTFGPLALDKPGPGYAFAAVSDRAFSGRWADGGLVGPIMPYGDVRVWERPEGYFCAHRISR